ncbi:PepSY-like domain-containing protein [Cesiribacter andamanensis]|uniref:Putative beta-lactamase-inhibitor-like PepSY-like domain-containing protein n=1 Tax=Cesiribacter andamanensis AMV16 TaxID=1279009 RepID=M7NC52_9BACT|nr:PepSY-like domain-containing protein [Cesiribacter andamanensis]EMR04741.1 hypothetical protein ADICEAN_00012 [Cesiribacter andamanensis AMV16]
MFKYYSVLVASFLFLGACSQSSDQQNEEIPYAATEAEPVDDRLERINTSAPVEEAEEEEEIIAEEEAIVLTPKEAFAKQYPGAQKIRWSEDDNGYDEASFEMDGEKYRADYTKEGEWVETESSLKYDVLPMAVQEVIEAKYNKEEITEVERVQHPSKGVFYDIEFKKDGKNHDVEIKENGEIIKE